VDTPLGPLPTATTVSSDDTAAVVRPEALQLTASAGGDAIVTGIDYFGHDQLVHVRLADGTEVRARRGPVLDLARGDRVEVAVLGPVTVFPSTTPHVRAALTA
jgi:iron(III) transport system ATP-binding protein